MCSVVYGSALGLCRYVRAEARLTMCCMWQEMGAEPRDASRRVCAHSSVQLYGKGPIGFTSERCDSVEALEVIFMQPHALHESC